jgi:thymidine kinase
MSKIIFARGRSNSGKTKFALEKLQHYSNLNKNILFISTEYNRFDTFLRLINDLKFTEEQAGDILDCCNFITISNFDFQGIIEYIVDATALDLSRYDAIIIDQVNWDNRINIISLIDYIRENELFKKSDIVLMANTNYKTKSYESKSLFITEFTK